MTFRLSWLRVELSEWINQGTLLTSGQSQTPSWSNLKYKQIWHRLLVGDFTKQSEAVEQRIEKQHEEEVNMEEKYDKEKLCKEEKNEEKKWKEE